MKRFAHMIEDLCTEKIQLEHLYILDWVPTTNRFTFHSLILQNSARTRGIIIIKNSSIDLSCSLHVFLARPVIAVDIFFVVVVEVWLLVSSGGELGAEVRADDVAVWDRINAERHSLLLKMWPLLFCLCWFGFSKFLAINRADRSTSPKSHRYIVGVDPQSEAIRKQ